MSRTLTYTRFHKCQSDMFKYLAASHEATRESFEGDLLRFLVFFLFFSLQRVEYVLMHVKNL